MKGRLITMAEARTQRIQREERKRKLIFGIILIILATITLIIFRELIVFGELPIIPYFKEEASRSKGLLSF